MDLDKNPMKPPKTSQVSMATINLVGSWVPELMVPYIWPRSNRVERIMVGHPGSGIRKNRLHLFLVWIVLACRMARGTDQVFIHLLLRAVAQTNFGKRDLRYIKFHWWGPKKNGKKRNIGFSLVLDEAWYPAME